MRDMLVNCDITYGYRVKKVIYAKYCKIYFDMETVNIICLTRNRFQVIYGILLYKI